MHHVRFCLIVLTIGHEIIIIIIIIIYIVRFIFVVVESKPVGSRYI